MLRSNWFRVQALAAVILLMLVICASVMSNYIMTQSEYLSMQSKMTTVFNSVRIIEGQLWVPVINTQYRVDETGQVYI